MKHTNLFSLSFILISFISIATLNASGQQEPKDTSQTVQKESLENIVSAILAEYSSDNLSNDDAIAIHEAFKEQGLRGGPELDDVIAALGFDPDELKKSLHLHLLHLMETIRMKSLVRKFSIIRKMKSLLKIINP